MKNFFFHELDQLLIQGELYRSSNPYSKVAKIYSILLDKHFSIK